MVSVEKKKKNYWKIAVSQPVKVPSPDSFASYSTTVYLVARKITHPQANSQAFFLDNVESANAERRVFWKYLGGVMPPCRGENRLKISSIVRVLSQALFLFSFYLIYSDGWGKKKLSSPHFHVLSHVTHVVCRIHSNVLCRSNSIVFARFIILIQVLAG